MIRRAVRRWYAEPRIAEAVFALGAPFAPPWPAEVYGRLASRFKGFAAREDRLAIDAPLARQGATPCPPADGAPHRVWRLNQEGHRAVQWGPGVVAFNVLPPYGHFEDHVPIWSNLIEAFLAEERPAAIGWAEQRYVNEFTLARAERPGDLFVFYPTLPDERERRHVMSRVDLDAGDFEGGAVRVRLLRTAADAEAVRYQLIVIAESRRSLSADGDAIMRWHNVAHNAINEAFERVITDETRRRMRQV
ncbi:MAG: TIGR04255 family protein [Kofleriaceae bacterium]|nr:TIGR04255 family protein [Myxococcales bacterium]MCB9563444.1 TIGR04255 family protein [Kofleriaceae bacterium]MCB9574300.1 TIGR04255 family protein [Kofleriaceae bacterium]